MSADWLQAAMFTPVIAESLARGDIVLAEAWHLSEFHFVGGIVPFLTWTISDPTTVHGEMRDLLG